MTSKEKCIAKMNAIYNANMEVALYRKRNGYAGLTLEIYPCVDIPKLKEDIRDNYDDELVCSVDGSRIISVSECDRTDIVTDILVDLFSNRTDFKED